MLHYKKFIIFIMNKDSDCTLSIISDTHRWATPSTVGICICVKKRVTTWDSLAANGKNVDWTESPTIFSHIVRCQSRVHGSARLRYPTFKICSLHLHGQARGTLTAPTCSQAFIEKLLYMNSWTLFQRLSQPAPNHCSLLWLRQGNERRTIFTEATCPELKVEQTGCSATRSSRPDVSWLWHRNGLLFFSLSFPPTIVLSSSHPFVLNPDLTLFTHTCWLTLYHNDSS